MSTSLAYDDLLRMIEELGPPKPRPVLIVAKWLPGPDGLRREYKGRDEFRITARAYAELERQAIRSEWNLPSTLFGIPVEYEDKAPGDLVLQMMAATYTADAPGEKK